MIEFVFFLPSGGNSRMPKVVERLARCGLASPGSTVLKSLSKPALLGPRTGNVHPTDIIDNFFPRRALAMSTLSSMSAKHHIAIHHHARS